MKEKRRKALRRAKRVRARVHGTAASPRLSIKRSKLHIYAQLIDDASGRTLASASDAKMKKEGLPIGMAQRVGALLAEQAKVAGVSRMVVDRGSYTFHGRVKALVDAAEAGGLGMKK